MIKIKKMSLQRKITSINVLLMTITLIVTLMITFKFNMDITEQNVESNILNISRLIATEDKIIEVLSKRKEDKDIINYLDDIINMTNDVDIIVVADNNGRRYYHPDKDKIGETFVGGDEKNILNEGRSYISKAKGTLGKQLRAFTAVRDEDGNQVGFIMVSSLIDNVNKYHIETIKNYLVVGLFIFSIGIFMSFNISKSIKKSLLGYEPDQFTKLYLQREEVLSSLEEGIIAVDSLGKIIIFNNSAINMLDIKYYDKIEEEFIGDVIKNKNIIDIINSKKSLDNREITTDKGVIIIDSIPIIEDNKIMGTVSICRNKTEVTRLAEELTGVNQVIEALRANTHEFMNKLHVILGLIQIDKIEEAKNYIMNINDEQKELMNLIIEKIKDPNIAALLIGKIRRAKELGINLNLHINSNLENNNKLLSRNSLITILGNLIENSIDSINEKDDDFKEINVLIYNDEDNLLINIDDSGMGISEENMEKIYTKGFSTKGDNRGIGMYLIKNIVENSGGIISIDSEENIGTCFSITISRKETNND